MTLKKPAFQVLHFCTTLETPKKSGPRKDEIRVLFRRDLGGGRKKWQPWEVNFGILDVSCFFLFIFSLEFSRPDLKQTNETDGTIFLRSPQCQPENPLIQHHPIPPPPSPPRSSEATPTPIPSLHNHLQLAFRPPVNP